MGYDGAWRAQRFHRDPHNDKLTGVCMCMADYVDLCREQGMELQHVGGYVTSSRYDLDRQFCDLEH